MVITCPQLVNPSAFVLSSDFYRRRFSSPFSERIRFHQISFSASFHEFQNPSTRWSCNPAPHPHSVQLHTETKEEAPSTSRSPCRHNIMGTMTCMAYLPSLDSPHEEEWSVWEAILQEAKRDANSEPILNSFLFSTVLSHPCLPHSLSFHLSNKLSSPLSTALLYKLFLESFSSPDLRRAVVADLIAVRGRDPACTSYSHCLLNYKGFLALQAHRVSHLLWKKEKSSVAFALQSRISDVFAVDIHPGARIGSGILLDHATGIVIGETTVIGDNVSIFHHVTLGGTGKQTGDRHPKVGNGVLIGAGAMVLGNVKIGDGAKIGAGSVVLKDVPALCTVVGTPARVVQKKIVQIPKETMDHTSFIKWIYVI